MAKEAISHLMICLHPVAHVRSPRIAIDDDAWGDVIGRIELDASMPDESLAGLSDFSHAEILFHFHKVSDSQVERGARHPRGNAAWPCVGIFAQRGKDRPNRLGSTIVEIISVVGRTLTVRGLDAIDGTPVLDIKPVLAEFLPRTPVCQPAWSRELMASYWDA